MVTPSTPGLAPAPEKPSAKNLMITCVVIGLALGVIAGYQPTNEWRFFSWHPFLMSLSFIGLMPLSAVIKKQGGYTNTKNHGMLAWFATFCAFAGLYVTYENKNRMREEHFTTYHSWGGLLCLMGVVGAGMAGGVFLHPDFGVDKTNQIIRKVHKVFSRNLILLGWLVCLTGVHQLAGSTMLTTLFAIPLVLLIPRTLV